jgi:hypothetical protein
VVLPSFAFFSRNPSEIKEDKLISTLKIHKNMTKRMVLQMYQFLQVSGHM